MKNLLIALFFLSPFTLSFGQQTISASIMHDGIIRTYILYVPDTYSAETAAPLLFNFHGYGSTSTEQMVYGDFRPIADTAGFLVVHPMGTEDALGTTHWNVGWETSTVDDVGFASTLIDSLALDFNIDFNKVYSTGMSNGGFMSYTLACNLSNRFSAIASVTGSMTKDQPNSCNCEHPMPIMEIHGTADATVPYNGYYLFESIEDVLNYWVDFNNCDTDPLFTEVPDIDPDDGCTAEHYLWSNGDNGAIVDHYKIINGGHTWPGSSYNIGVTNHDINASIEIWKFFSKYDINGLINATTTDQLDEGKYKVSIYPNPFSSHVFIDGDFSQPKEYQVYSSIGELVQSGTLHFNHDKINLSDLSASIYLLKIEDQAYNILRLE